MRLGQTLDSFRVNGFVRSVGVLVSGTVLAHAVTAAALPILTRLYSPADFNLLAAFTAAFGIASVAACLRFELAIPIPSDDGDAANLLGLAITFALVLSAALAIGVWSAPATVSGWLNQPGLERYLWLLPLAVLLAGCYAALQFWFVRKESFASLARTRVAQSCAAAGTQVGLGLAGLAPFGLLLGQTLNSGAGFVGLGYRLLRSNRAVLGAVSIGRMRAMFRAYDRFPKYSTLEALCNSASMQLPILLIVALATGPEAGFLVLAMFVMQAPMSLIGTAIGQVYLSRAADERRSGQLGPFTMEVFAGLVRNGVGPLVFAGIVAPGVFGIVFGDDWHRAGTMVAWMTPWFVLQLLSVPVATALHVCDRQGTALALQVFGLTLRVAAVYVASLLPGGHVSEAYALSGLVFYLVYLVTILRVVAARLGDVREAVVRGLAPLLAWAASGAVFALLAAAAARILQ